jgi:hypothetical protein
MGRSSRSQRRKKPQHETASPRTRPSMRLVPPPATPGQPSRLSATFQRLDGLAERVMTAVAPQGRIEIRRSRKLTRMLGLGLFAAAVILSALATQIHAVPDQQLITDARALMRETACEREEKPVLYACVPLKSWNAASSDVKNAWSLGEFFRHPTMSAIRVQDEHGRPLATFGRS